MLTIRHKRHFYEPRVPHAVFLDGLFAGVLDKDDTLRVDAPAGTYTLKVQFGGILPLGKTGKTLDLSLSSTQQIELPRRGDTHVEFHDRERLWNILFDIDFLAWIISLFHPMPSLYKILSDTFFALWLLRLLLIRKKYYKITIE